MKAVNSNQYDEYSDDEISGFANTTKFPPPICTKQSIVYSGVKKECDLAAQKG